MEKKLMILFGTETGNAEMLAHDAATAAKSAGLRQM